jgi:hypothetical protein
MRRVLLLAGVLATAMIVSSGVALAQAEPQREPLNTTFLSPCTEELILFEGFAHFIPQRVHHDQGGGLHGTAQGLNQGEGVGAVSGAKYIYISLNTGASTLRLDGGTNTSSAVFPSPSYAKVKTVVRTTSWATPCSSLRLMPTGSWWWSSS